MSDYENGGQAEQRSSVKITLNAKGEAQVEVKVYAGDTQADVDSARVLAVDAFKRTRQEVGR